MNLKPQIPALGFVCPRPFSFAGLPSASALSIRRPLFNVASGVGVSLWGMPLGVHRMGLYVESKWTLVLGFRTCMELQLGFLIEVELRVAGLWGRSVGSREFEM